MKYVFVLILSVLLLPSYLLIGQENITINGKVNLDNTSEYEVSVFAVYHGSSLDGNLLIAKTKADENGKFKLEFPDYIINADIFIVSPHHKYTLLKYIKGDTRPFIKAKLEKNQLIEQLDSAKIVFLKNYIEVTVPIPIENNEYETNLDINSNEMAELKLELGDTIQYYYSLNNEKCTPVNSEDPIEYRKDFIYKGNKIIDSEGIKFEIDFSHYQAKEKEPKESSSEWVNSPVNQQYSEIIELLPINTITQLNPNYTFIVRQTYPDVIKDLPKEKLDSMKENVINDYNSFMRINDSLMNVVKFTYLHDYLKYLRLEMIKGPATEYTVSSVKSVIESTNEVPIKFKYEIVTYVYSLL